MPVVCASFGLSGLHLSRFQSCFALRCSGFHCTSNSLNCYSKIVYPSPSFLGPLIPGPTLPDPNYRDVPLTPPPAAAMGGKLARGKFQVGCNGVQGAPTTGTHTRIQRTVYVDWHSESPYFKLLHVAPGVSPRPKGSAGGREHCLRNQLCGREAVAHLGARRARRAAVDKDGPVSGRWHA